MRELARQALLVTDSGESKAVRNSTQPESFGRNMFLPFHVSSSDDQCEAMKHRVSQLVVFENRLEGASFSAMVQPHVGNSRCVEGNRLFPSRGVEELVFGYEKKFGLRINEPPNEPREATRSTLTLLRVIHFIEDLLQPISP